jgi:methionine-rich copper-binding protein CopC
VSLAFARKFQARSRSARPGSEPSRPGGEPSRPGSEPSRPGGRPRAGLRGRRLARLPGGRPRVRLLRWLAVPVATAVAGALLIVAPAIPAKAACGNPIACENALTGTPQTTWDVPNPSTNIVGFADPFSVNAGGTINFKVKTSATLFTIDIYRIGYYGGAGARKITSVTPNILASQNQPACNTNTVTGLVDCGNWSVSASWAIPSTAVSGVYFAKLTRTDGTSGANQIPFVVTNNSSHSDIAFMTSDETWQAYNDYGGYSVYTGNATGTPWCCSAQNPGRAVQVSYNRPFLDREDTPFGQDYFFYAEFPMIQFLEKNGYDVSYVSQIDVAQSSAPTMLEQHKMLMNVGHSEYFDAQDRANITTARNAGVSLSFFTGNTMWWKTRWANSQYNNEPYRTLITYKETLDSTQSDPADPTTWTGAWRDPRFSPPSDGSPENSLTGQLWLVNCCSYADTVPAAYSKLRLWRNTAVASLASGQTYTMPPETLGYEWDSDVDNGSRPAGEIDMSQTCEKVDQKLYTVTEEFVNDNACNSLTLYRASSGALVFNAGTVQWAWGLESDHDGDTNNAPDTAMQQATVNLFADMGAQPATLESDLLRAPASNDKTAPTSAITSPSAGATYTNGATVTVTGTAADTGGGVVAGVEVSTDGGSTWHPVTSMSAAATSVTWSYTWSATGSGPVTIKSRATDDSENTGAPSAGVPVTVNCPCGLFGANYTPYVPSANDSSPYELGMKFSSSVSGWVAGVRFYKGTGNGGTHTGSLWTASGTQLATGLFFSETASGWQTMVFPNPVQISANTTYVVSYYDPQGHYSVDEDLFDTARTVAPLTGLKSNFVSVAGGDNGLYNPGGPGFPTHSYHGWSYTVDVIFDTTQPPAHPAVTSSTPVTGSSSNPTSTDPSVTFSEAVVPSSVSFTMKDSNGNAVPGTTSFDSSDTVATFTPASQLAAGATYTVTISGAKDSNGQTMLAPYSYTFITSQAFDSGGKCPCAIWPDVAPASVSDSTDQSSGVELGVRFTAAQDGKISGIRFYKVPDNAGTHTGTLWSSTGTQLATGTFSNESTQGWEELDFSTPVSITAGTTYIASYHTSAWHYAYTAGALSSSVTSGPLTAQANGGVYAYGTSSTFPTNSFNGTNYWVDVVYNTSSGSFAPAVTSVTPTNASQGNPVTVAPTATFSQAVVPNTVSFTLKDSNGTAVSGTTQVNSAGTVATFTPSGSLAADTTYTATVSGAQNTFGTPMTGPYSWTFSTAGSQCPCSIWPNSATPSVISANDPGPVNLGVQFTASANGWVSGIRFYKGSTNTGTHVGSLWTSSGTLLGQVTFTNESASGWQEADFATPVPVTAGTTYVASYYAPSGGYSYDSAAFASSGVTNGPLTALANSSASPGNGVYGYSGSPAFPNGSFNATNYWVDVVFTEP